MLQQQQNLGLKFGTSKMHLSPPPRGLGCCPFLGGGSVAVDSLLILPLWDSVIVLCFAMRYFMSILVLQSSLCGRESWLLCLVCLPGDCCVALPCGAMGLSAVCDCGIS